VVCIVLPIFGGVATGALLIWHRTRNLGAGVLLTGVVLGILIAALIFFGNFPDSWRELPESISYSVFAGIGGFGIGSLCAIAVGLPVFSLILTLRRPSW
jgi:multidrug transporter EmrE-like cation transporter